MTNLRNEGGDITTDYRNIKEKIVNVMNNFMPTHWTTWMKWPNSLKDTHYKNSRRNK